MKKKVLMVLLLILLVGVAFFAYLNIKKTVVTVPQQNTPQIDTSKQSAQVDQATIVKQAEFQSGDQVHQASGQAKIIKTDQSTVLQFENFKVIPGPDLFVYLSPNKPKQDLGNFISLGKLKSTSGPQTYTLPDNYEDYQTVVIWCRAFSITFATAELD